MKTGNNQHKLLCIAVCAMLFAFCSPAQAQQAGKFYRVGILRSGSPSSKLYAPQRKVFKKSLHELGYIEGRNLLIEYRYANSKLDQLPELARQLVELKIDVLVISPSPVTIRSAQAVTRAIPIVVLGSPLDPVKAGFVGSLAKPGGNITGLTNLDTALHGKRLGLLKETFPSISRVAIIWSGFQHEQAITEVQAAAQAVGIQVQSVTVDTNVGLASLQSSLSTINQAPPDGLLVGSIRTTLRHQGRIIDFVVKKRLPAIYARDSFVKAGGLMSYSADDLDIYRRAAAYVDKILRGAKAGDLPMEQPTKFELVINLKAAKQIGLTIPQSVLYQADRVIR